jgi:hypothetical protein
MIEIPRTIHRRTNDFFNGRHINRRDDRLRGIYVGISSPLYKIWNEAGQPRGCVWRHKNKVIAVRLHFYNTQGIAYLLRDNGDRGLPVFLRLHSIWSRVYPNSSFLFRSSPRRGIWHIVKASPIDPAESPEVWTGQKIIIQAGDRNLPQGQSVRDRLTHFTACNMVDLRKFTGNAGIDDTGWLVDLVSGQDRMASVMVRSMQPPDNELDDIIYDANRPILAAAEPEVRDDDDNDDDYDEGEDRP